MIIKENFLLLTKSAKDGGFCVAGWTFDNQGNVKWIRLVENETGKTIYRYKDFFRKRNVGDILDFIEVEYVPVPLSIQSENCLLLNEPRCIHQYYFRDFYSWNPNIINNANLLKPSRNYLTIDEAEQFDKSLMLADIDNLCLYIVEYTDKWGRLCRKTKANFSYKGMEFYNYSVTDQDYFYIKKDLYFGKCKIILSIPEKWFMLENFESPRYYKFIAKIFNPNIYKF